MKYQLHFVRSMPKKYWERMPVWISRKVFDAVAVSHTIKFEGETFNVINIVTDVDAEIAYVEVDNGLRKT